MIFERKVSFQNFLKGQNYNDYLEKHCRKNEWADETIILATTLAINRLLIAFSLTTDDSLYILIFCKEKNSLDSFSNNEPLGISFFYNHYTSLMRQPSRTFNFKEYLIFSENVSSVSF